MAEFVVLSLPRSRSAWMSRFLAYGPRNIEHDMVIECGSLDQFIEQLHKVDGSVETGAVLGWRVIRDRLPWARLAVVRRAVGEVEKSLRAFGITGVRSELETRDQMLQVVSKLPGVLSLEYGELNSSAGLRKLFEHCLAVPFDEDWAEQWQRVNVQIDMGLQIDRLRANQEALEHLRAETVIESRRLGNRQSMGLQ